MFIAQDKITLQVKTFDQDLKPFPNIEIAFNDLDFFAVNNKGTAIIELDQANLPVKTIRVKDTKLEAASWNLSKGTIEIIIRPVKTKIMHVSVHFSDGSPLANTGVVFKGSTTINMRSDQVGTFDLPMPIEDNVRSASQFEVANLIVSNVSVNGDAVTLTVERPKQIQPEVTKKNEIRQAPPTFDVASLDSIRSLSAFYALFKTIPINSLPEDVRLSVDAKFKALIEQRQDSLRASHELYIRGISDTSMVVEDIRNLLKQASAENTTLHKNRDEFETMIVTITSKLKRGVVNLSPEEKTSLRRDIDLLEQLLLENESQFYENHNDYREIINTLREKFLEVEKLQNRLTEAELLRLQQNKEFRERLFVIGSIVIAFGLLIILLISFSSRLRRQKKSLQNANERIEQINENLESIVARRTRLLEEANKELDTFLYRASHDLRSPVLSLTGLSQIVDHIDRQEMVQHVRLATDSMNRVLNKLVDISEISQEVNNIKTVKVREIINKIRNKHLVMSDMSNLRERHAVTVRKRAVQFDVECDDTSPSLLEVILDNLVENAIFFGGLKESDENIVVEVAARMHEDVLELRVRDNGVGISEELRPRVFEMFFSGNIGSRGSGLGLYAVKKCVVALQGTIRFESEENKFTLFMVAIPSSQKK
jgi:signal transduction histidine kinase